MERVIKSLNRFRDFPLSLASLEKHSGLVSPNCKLTERSSLYDSRSCEVNTGNASIHFLWKAINNWPWATKGWLLYTGGKWCNKLQDCENRVSPTVPQESACPEHSQGPAWRVRFVGGRMLMDTLFTTERHSAGFLHTVLLSRWSTLLKSAYGSIPERIGRIFVNITYFIIMYTINMPAHLGF